MAFMYDVLVVGGGVIGLTIARDLSRDRSVLIIDRGLTGEGTSWAAAGMLSPQSEADEDGAFFRLCLASSGMFRQFADDLQSESGHDPEYDPAGLLAVASTDRELETLRSRLGWQRDAGLAGELLSAEEVRNMEPLITAEIAGGLFLPDDHHVVPRKLCRALADSCVKRGVEVRTGVSVSDVLSERGRIIAIRAGGEVVPCGDAVICSGVWSGQISGLAPSIPVYPRKGQILSLSGAPHSFRRMIRWKHSYFIPRRDGELVIGATNEDAGFDRSITPAGVGGLLSDAGQIASSVSSLPIREIWTGLRPATPDGLPVIGTSAIAGLHYATGHYRNGILLAPVTALAIRATIDGSPSPMPIDNFSPRRFESTHV
jgi:glycine oxidase